MKKVLLISGAILALTATMASAQGGINLSWTDCGVNGTAARTSACTTNSGTNVMVASIITPVAMPNFNGMAGVVDLQTNVATLSAWWDFASCRSLPTSSLSVSFDFTTSSLLCTDTWGGGATGGFTYAYQFGQPNRARIRCVAAVPIPISTDGLSEDYMFKVAVNNAHTVAGCAGCTDGACIVLNSVQVTQPAGLGPSFTLTNPLLRNFITWQSGGSGVGVGPYGGTGCPGATPTHNNTWGSVKSLYR